MRRPGFFSATGVVAAVVVVLAAGATALLAGPSLFSPGALNAQTSAELALEPAASPASLGGVTSHAGTGDECGACHPAPWSSRTMADACVACHTGVGDQISGGKGLHGRLEGLRTSPTCAGCHPEHDGAYGALTVLDERSFGDTHEVAGFSLDTHRETQSGAAFACHDCHPAGYDRFSQRVCTDCHAEIDDAFMRDHEATFGRDCLACHDGTGAARVDHDRFAFKLTGKHRDVACEDCHEGARTGKDYRDAPTDCYGCHAEDDEHDGAYGRECGDCHTARAWGDVTFDHKVFPLDHGSEEQRATCQTCHPRGTSTYTCYGCHEHTTANVLGKHEGRPLSELADCVRCHPGGREAEGGD